jgi:glycosyltransferase involved in cell wall biosynthesis
VTNLFYASPRIPGLAKYLPEFGWQPIILTTPLGDRPDERFGPPNDFRKNNRVIETFGYTSQKDVGVGVSAKKQLASKKPFKYVKPLIRFLYKRYLEIVHYPDAEKGWKPFAVKAGDELLKEEDIDAMISDSSPVTAHIIAKELKSKFNIPWVADFRDLWTQNHNYPYTKLRKLFEKRLEIKTLATADALVTVSPLWTEQLQVLHKGKMAYTITNGFDPEKMSDGKGNLTSKFTITYTGQIYKKQDPSKLLIALKDLIFQGTINPNEVEVRFYGPQNKQLFKNIEECGLSAVVKQCGIISREASFEKQRESQILLLLNWEDPLVKGVIPGKIFEYFAAQRPLLVTGGFGNDVVEMLLKETNSGMYCSTIEDIKKALKEFYSEYKFKGRVTYNGNIEKINQYSYREMARKFANLLNNLAERQ